MRRSLRYLRHGPLKRYESIWLRLGKMYHQCIKKLPFFPAAKIKIGSYGPYWFHPSFAFSAFHQWGIHHNIGFRACIEDCRDKQCVLDIGAHIGLVSLPISQVLAPNGTVYAFEPADTNRHYLEYHIKKNRRANIEVVPLLVGDRCKDHVPFFELDDDTGMNSVAHIHKNKDFKQKSKQQITLDVFCYQYQLKPEVIKIDVEGYEIEVLKGAPSILLHEQPTIYLSVHPKHLQALGHTIKELTDFIDSMNYCITEIDGSEVKQFTLSEYVLRPATKMV